MTCKDVNNIHIRFPRSGLELRPYTVDFRVDRRQFDYLDAKFSEEVGDYLEPYINDEDSIMRPPQPVEVIMDDSVSHWMYYRPQFVTIGETNCWIELHDPQKQLEYDVVDYNVRGTARGIYEMIIEEANVGDIIKDVEFEISQDAMSHLPTQQMAAGPGGTQLPITGRINATAKLVRGVRSWTQDYDEGNYEPSQTILDSEYNFNLENSNALEALYTVNDKLGLQSWMTHEGILKIGNDVFDANTHVASSNDSRVWRYSDVSITPPGTPIKLAVVNGGMIDAPNSTSEEGALESAAEFLNPFDGHEQDLIAQGVAQNPGVIDGKIVSVDQPNLARDGLRQRAEQFLLNEISNNNSGSMTIDPDASGTEISDWRDLKVGDFIVLVPAEDEDCREIEEQVVIVSGVDHQIDSGSWNIELDVQKWIDTEPETKLRYFSPDSTSYYDENFEEIYSSDDG